MGRHQSARVSHGHVALLPENDDSPWVDDWSSLMMQRLTDTGCQNSSHSCTYRGAKRRKLVFKAVQVADLESRRQDVSMHVRRPTTAVSQASTSEPAATDHMMTAAIQQTNSTQSIPNSSIAGRSPPLSIPFFRWFGPTGIAPGYKRFFVPIENRSEQMPPRPDDAAPNSAESVPLLFSSKDDPNRHLFEPDDNLTPSSEILFPLLDTFFEYYSCHFPYKSRDSFIESVRESKVSALLLNSMCAMAARFSALPILQGQPAYIRGEPFCNKAKHLLVPLLNVPSFEVLESILMIAWMELATCHDVGLWMYTGMAVRMAEDMGMHKVGPARTSFASS